jgi:hypothetical protein
LLAIAGDRWRTRNVIKLRITILTKVRISFIITKCIVILAKARTFCPINLMTLGARVPRVLLLFFIDNGTRGTNTPAAINTYSY